MASWDWGQAGTGAATGAGIGATVGGPWGAAIGGAAGGLFGGIGGLGGTNRLSEAEKKYGGIDQNNYNVPGYGQSFGQYGQMAGQYGGRSSPYAGQMEGLANQYQREASGNGIGQRLIRNQAQGMADRGARQQLAMAASARPGNTALATRGAMMNAGNMNAQVGGQSANAQGQYQLGAMQGYGQQLSQMDDARLRQLGLNDQSQLDALRQRLQLQGMQQQGGMNYEQNRTQRYGIAAGAPTQGEQLLGGLGGLASAYMQMKSRQGTPGGTPGTTG